MKKFYLALSLFCVAFFGSAQNDYLKSGTFLNYSIEITLSESAQNNPKGLINSLYSIPSVKDVQLTSPSKVNVLIYGNESFVPNLWTNSMLGTFNQFVDKIVFNDLEQVLNNFKSERVYFKSFAISGLSNKSEAQQIVTYFLNSKGVLFANADYDTHQVFLILKNELPDFELNQIIKDSGKNVIEFNEEISKYY
ncbi:MAG: hypothetical protein HYU67_01125 [Flavobacteriia bacterium]|nr:hypothetical protein [Flavobacteriia bacterium]